MWKELTGPPRVTDKGLELKVPAAKRGFSLFGGSDGVKMVPITDHASAQVRTLNTLHGLTTSIRPSIHGRQGSELLYNLFKSIANTSRAMPNSLRSPRVIASSAASGRCWKQRPRESLTFYYRPTGVCDTFNRDCASEIPARQTDLYHVCVWCLSLCHVLRLSSVFAICQAFPRSRFTLFNVQNVVLAVIPRPMPADHFQWMRNKMEETMRQYNVQ